jgi:hypothetical protein
MGERDMQVIPKHLGTSPLVRRKHMKNVEMHPSTVAYRAQWPMSGNLEE